MSIHYEGKTAAKLMMKEKLMAYEKLMTAENTAVDWIAMFSSDFVGYDAERSLLSC